MSFRIKVCSCLAACLLAALMPSITSAATITVALSDNDSAFGLNKGAALDPVFSGLGAADMVTSSTDDTYIAKANGSAFALNQNFSGSTTVGANGTAISLFKFDLSSIPSNATIEKAQLQLWGTTGNQNIANSSFGAIRSFDWSEGTVTANSPVGTASTPEWGAGSSVFDIAGGVDVPATSAIDSRSGFQTYSNPAPGGIGHIDGKATGQNVFSLYAIEDVKTSLQSMIGGSNFGWAANTLNYSFRSSESDVRNGFAGSNFGTGTRPTLFVQYTEADIPEPTSLLILALGLGLVGCKVRRTRS